MKGRPLPYPRWPLPSFHCGSVPLCAQHILSACGSTLEAHGHLTRLANALVSGSVNRPLVEWIQPLEGALKQREATLEEASGEPGATAASVVGTVLQEAKSHRSRKPGDTGDEGDSLREDAIEAALLSPAFKALTQSLRGADVSTKQGVREVIAKGFDGKCVLAVRSLCGTKQATSFDLHKTPSLGVARRPTQFPLRLPHVCSLSGCQHWGDSTPHGTLLHHRAPRSRRLTPF